jgi:uncharacterized membrane protein YesL
MAERKNNKGDNSSKKTLFKSISGYDKVGKGVKKKKITDKERYSLKSFFAVYKSQFWNLIILNLIFMLMISPAICGILAYTGVFADRVQTPSNILYAPVYGAHLCSPNPATAALVGIFGTQGVVAVGNSVTTALYCAALAVFLTFGFANAGMTFILRAYTRSEFVFLWHDFFGTIKKNFFGALALGAADLAVICLIIYSAVHYYTASMDFSYTILFFITFSAGVIYFLMRFYLYILLITFKLSPIKLIKNAFILALLGIKRNVAAILGIGVFALICVAILVFSVPLGVTLPFFFVMAHCGFMACFAAYPNVKKYMIDPYYAEKEEKGEKGGKTEIEEEPVFIDRG